MARGDNPRSGGNGRFERTLPRAQRDADAARLRAQGHTYAAIAERLGYRGWQAARYAVERALVDTVTEPAAEVRQLELARLDEALKAAFEVLHTKHLVVSNGIVVRVRGINPDTGKRQSVPLLDSMPRLAAIDRIVKISERRSKLLGLDAPTKIEVLTLDVIDAEIARLTAELGVQPGATPPP
jgi:hypothetical protein